MSWRERLREELKDIKPYRAVDAPARVCLDANESPLGLPAGLQEELARSLASIPLNRYPDILAGELRAVVAADLGVDPSQLLFGNGSDELISLLAGAFGRPPRNQSRMRVVYPVPTFVMYRLGTVGAGALPIEAPLRPDFTLDEVALDRAIVAGQPNLCFLAWPNNPTGTLFPREAIVKLLRAHPSLLVVVDEAYGAFAQESCLDLIGQHENVVVLRTLSKIGLAALRVGFLVGRTDLVREVEKVRAPYNLGALAQQAAVFALTRAKAELQAHVAQVISERERVAAALANLGVTVFPSRANFLLVRVADADTSWHALLEKGVRVKNLHRPRTPLENCLRITIGTPPENDALLAAWGRS